MNAHRLLVVYYSRTGMTRLVSSMLADELDCAVEELCDVRSRVGLWGLLTSTLDGVLERGTRLQPVREDPAIYDLVVVATPVWSSSVSAAVRTYLEERRGRFRKVAFALTQGTVGRARVFRQMEALCGSTPLTTLAVTESDFQRGHYRRKVSRFAARIRAELRGEELSPELAAEPVQL
jgi:flavodoxin